MYQRSKIMKHYFRTIAVLAVSWIGSELVPALKADQWDRTTNIKIDQAIDVQGTILPPGSYVVKLLAGSVERQVVQIFNAADHHLIVTILAIPAYRLEAGEGDFEFYKADQGQPPALRLWFYPGDNFGLEFKPDHGEASAHNGRKHADGVTATGGGE
jgi:hypothetical protein